MIIPSPPSLRMSQVRYGWNTIVATPATTLSPGEDHYTNERSQSTEDLWGHFSDDESFEQTWPHDKGTGEDSDSEMQEGKSLVAHPRRQPTDITSCSRTE